MLDDDNNNTSGSEQETTTRTTRRRAAGRAAGPPAAISTDIFSAPEPGESGSEATSAPTAQTPTAQTPTAQTSDVESTDAAKKAASRRRGKAGPVQEKAEEKSEGEPRTDSTAKKTAKKPAKKSAGTKKSTQSDEQAPAQSASPEQPEASPATPTAAFAAPTFQAPETTVRPARSASGDGAKNDAEEGDGAESSDDSEGGNKRRRRSRGGRRRTKSDDTTTDSAGEGADDTAGSDDDAKAGDAGDGSAGSRRRRRRARSGEGAGRASDDPEDTVVKVREGRSAEDEITGLTGSTRLEAKKQRRREGREAGRRRAPIVSEAEFLARRESVERQMVVRQSPAPAHGAEDNAYTQIAVLEDSVLVEHYVARESQVSIIGNVYLGKVQNVLPSMEAAFVDIGAGRNAVIYAGEVDWSGVQNGKARKIEEALQPGQTILVQATKDPVGQKGARLTSQISLPGRFLVYVPGGQSNGISRKLPDTERSRLKALLKEVLPEDAGVIVRTAAEGASEEQLTRDVTALKARWDDIESKTAQGSAPQLLYAEPDLVIKVVRDLFNEDFSSLVVDGPDAWDNISGYIQHVAPDLAERLSEWRASEHDGQSAFEALRIDEQIHKALEHKVWLPSGGSLIIDRTEAMTVVDVNTGKFTGSGGNLEETVTKNNLEAAEEMVRQLRLRDIGGIIVIDFIDMVLESNRDLVLRRLVECLGRDRTRHQVAEVTSLGLVQMTRKRIGTGLLESFSTDCEHCKGRGTVITAEPVEPKKDDGPRRGGGRRRGGKGGNGGNGGGGKGANAGGKDDGGKDDGGGGRGKDKRGSSGANAKDEAKGATTGDAKERTDSESGGEQAKPAETKPRKAGRKQGAPETATAQDQPNEPAEVATEKVDDQLGTSPVLTDTPEAP